MQDPHVHKSEFTGRIYRKVKNTWYWDWDHQLVRFEIVKQPTYSSVQAKKDGKDFKICTV